MIVQFDEMVRLEPEQLSSRILSFLLLINLLITGFPLSREITEGSVSHQVSFYTGLKSTPPPNSQLIVVSIVSVLCLVITGGLHIYGKKYLDKLHSIRVIQEKALSIRNIVEMKTVIIFVMLTSITSLAGIIINFSDQRLIPLGLILSVTIATGILIKFSQNPQIKEFHSRKLSQNKTNLTEIFFWLKFSFLKLRENRVGI
ncbi:uncharacterized protein LOC111694882 [Eurytemora carolleeae]|uniref:uncharacterized protein LOC111694882 n=1 Tax=Eurytemora carolleeae TaxID=1294199 RepID=UPI000C78E0FD|nr:uncharacterized protein LOC111694882 [Eurytemora carolleeae]|eukprot:XP_023319703.1 uncharacterized protein LOC111694882 [Eurytemora affinis]